ncbi:MAG: hypothetical protein IKN95_04155 [Lachnospiraceae bacterium]|nr:hypothetical protein [Lachnospiraceae bacterium]
MKSSVASRKQRFWALLLAVVMVVGLLPTAGVNAKTISIDGYDVGSYVPVGTVLSAGDLLNSTGDFLKGKYELTSLNDVGNLYVHYFDVDDGNEYEDVEYSGANISKNKFEDDKK